jgi:hypothetical protein
VACASRSSDRVVSAMESSAKFAGDFVVRVCKCERRTALAVDPRIDLFGEEIKASHRQRQTKLRRRGEAKRVRESTRWLGTDLR